MSCNFESPYCDTCYTKALEELEGFEPCPECKEMEKSFCWVCMGGGLEDVQDGACRNCRGKNFLTPPDGFTECNHCNGYGSSLKDPEGVDTCTKCKGSGLMPKEDK